MRKPILFFVIIFSLSFSGNCFALAVNTHHEINSFVMSNMSSTFNNTLRNYNLSGIGEQLRNPATNENKRIADLIANGGITEDDTPRWGNHYHNPLQDWKTSGYKGDPFFDYFLGLNHAVHGIYDSDPLWAQNLATLPNNYSWPSARKYFYDALTAKDEDTRNENFINCFRSVGQVMHLLQDMSVPAHVRDDSHPIGNIYEIWVNNELDTLGSAVFDSTYLNLASPTPDPSLIKIWDNGGNVKTPVMGLFDADVYNAPNPDPNLTTGAVGLSEYTNANFFSENTMFSQAFPYPAESSTEIVIVNLSDSPDPQDAKLRSYYLKTKDGEMRAGSHNPADHKDSGYLLSTVHFLKDYVTDKIQTLHSNDTKFLGLKIMDPLFRSDVARRLKESPGLDDFCYTDYATKLLPRAVGYSKALLQYFFRGVVDAVEPWETKDIKDDKLVVTGVTMKVKNSTPGEEMGDVANNTSGGKVEVACRYKLAGDEKYYYVKSSQGTQEDADGNDQPLSVVLGCYSTNSTTDKEVKFKFPDDTPVPYNAPVKEYMLVYRGKLGAEDDAVAAKSFTAGTPTVIDNWNAAQNWMTDKPSLVTLSRETASPLEGQGMLKIDIAEDDLCDVMREVLPNENNVYMSIGRSIYPCCGGVCSKIVTGTDTNSYTCIKDHTSSDENRPVTGENWGTYWAFHSHKADDGEAWGAGADYSVPFNYNNVGYYASNGIGLSLEGYDLYQCYLKNITLRMRGGKDVSAGRCWLEVNCRGTIYKSETVDASSLKTDSFDDVTFHFNMFPMFTWYSSLKLTGDEAFLDNVDNTITPDTILNCDRLKGCGDGPKYRRVQVMTATSDYSGPSCGQEARTGNFKAKSCGELDLSQIPLGDLGPGASANGIAYKLKGFDQFDSSIAYFNPSRNCSGKKYIRFVVKSHITGTPLAFRYGNQDYVTGGLPIEVIKPDTWEIKTIDISALPEAAKAKMNNWGIGWGPDSYDSSTGRSKANTIYIDMLDAEGTSVTPEPPPPPPCPDCPPPPPT